PHRIAPLRSHLKNKHGVICTLGNHDYSIYGRNQSSEGARRADYLAKCLMGRGLRVLRNQTEYLKTNGAKKPLAIVGLDDEWSGHIDPEKGFNGVRADLPIICLNHNPANVLQLMDY